MADRYWVGGGSANTWVATGNTNWSATDGGANNASVPGSGDVAIFNANSGSGNSVISAGITVQKLICTNYTGTLTQNAASGLTLNTAAADTLILGSGMTFSPAAASSIITISATSGNSDITTNGKRLGAFTVNGVGGTARLLDALRVDALAGSTLTITNGTFNANNFAVTANKVDFSSSNTKVVTMGSGTWTIGGNVTAGTTIWNASATGTTFNANTANIVVPASTVTGAGRLFAGGGLSYPNTLTLSAQSVSSIFNLTGSNTFGTFNVNAGNSIALSANTTQTITNAPTWTGTQANPILVGLGSQATAPAALSISSGTMTLQWGGLSYISASGGAVFVATNTFDFGGNSGWSISSPNDAATSAAAIAAAVWQDATAGDFTVAGSIGKWILDKLDVVLSTRAAASTALTNATWTDARAVKLDNLDATVSSRLAAASYTTPPTAVQNRAEMDSNSVGLAAIYSRIGAPAGASTAADIAAVKADTAVIKTKTDALPASPAATSDIPSAASIASAVWTYAVEGSYTAVQYMRGFASSLIWKSSGQATANPKFRSAADDKDRIDGTADADGNRTAVTVDLS